jgi:transposase
VEGAVSRRSSRGFGSDGPSADAGLVDLKALQAKVGELTLEDDFMDGALGKAGLLGAKR